MPLFILFWHWFRCISNITKMSLYKDDSWLLVRYSTFAFLSSLSLSLSFFHRFDFTISTLLLHDSKVNTGKESTKAQSEIFSLKFLQPQAKIFCLAIIKKMLFYYYYYYYYKSLLLLKVIHTTFSKVA